MPISVTIARTTVLCVHEQYKKQCKATPICTFVDYKEESDVQNTVDQ